MPEPDKIREERWAKMIKNKEGERELTLLKSGPIEEEEEDGKGYRMMMGRMGCDGSDDCIIVCPSSSFRLTPLPPLLLFASVAPTF